MVFAAGCGGSRAAGPGGNFGGKQITMGFSQIGAESEDITIVSIDSVKDIFLAMMEGKANCTVECNPLQGPKLMETAKKILNDEKVEKIVYVEEGIYPADVAEKILPERRY